MKLFEINYQGEFIEVEVIDQINTARGEGTDSILRDADGRYFFSRHREPEDGGFSVIHQVNINTVLLRAASLLNDQRTVREDAADLLMSARGGYFDPRPDIYSQFLHL